jgi:hypothetical protein
MDKFCFFQRLDDVEVCFCLDENLFSIQKYCNHTWKHYDCYIFKLNIQHAKDWLANDNASNRYCLDGI